MSTGFFEGRALGLSTELFVMFRRIGGHAIRCAGRRPAARRKAFPERGLSGHSHYTTASSGGAGANGSSSVPASTAGSPFGSVTVELDRIAPRFEISASQITILDSPASFYGTLKVRQFRSAKDGKAFGLIGTGRIKSGMPKGAFISLRCISARRSMSCSRRLIRLSTITQN